MEKKTVFSSVVSSTMSFFFFFESEGEAVVEGAGNEEEMKEETILLTQFQRSNLLEASPQFAKHKSDFNTIMQTTFAFDFSSELLRIKFRSVENTEIKMGSA